MNLNSCLIGQAFLSGGGACDASVYKKGEQV